MAAAQPTVDSDFFTRLGLRYINALPVDQKGISGWINPMLIAPLVAGQYGDVEHYETTVRGHCDGGKFVFRHGLLIPDGNRYGLDADFYAEDVEWNAVEHRLRTFNENNFRLFTWAIDEKAREYLGPLREKSQMFMTPIVAEPPGPARETASWMAEGAGLGGIGLRDQTAIVVPSYSYAPLLKSGESTETEPLTPIHEKDAPSGAEVVNEERLVLLARKFDRAVPLREENARIAILNERMRRLLPPVSLIEYDALEEVMTRMDEIDEESRSLMKSLGLPHE